MNLTDLQKIKRLFFEAYDVYDSENSNHKHLKQSLQETLEILNRENVIDENNYLRLKIKLK